MVSKAVHKYARVSPKKARVVLDLIRGKSVEEASSILLSARRRVAPLLSKLLKSAVANASEKGYSDIDSLYIKEVYATQGPTLKRFKARAMGRAFARTTKMSHITIVLEQRGF